MSVLCVGVSHRSAPVSLLERLTVGIEPAETVLHELRVAGPVSEAVVLSTCNRVEVYADTEGFHAGVDAVRDLLAQRSGVPLAQLQEHLYVHWEAQAVSHLFTVAAGLDSMVVGEAQILGQLRAAYLAARDGAAAGRTLHELFQKALHVGKKVHSDTGIDEAGQSLVSVALERAVEAVGPLAGRPVLVVGAGSMGALAGATLKRAGAGSIVVANRSVENARRLAAALEGEGVGLDALDEAVAQADVVVTSTGATGLVVPHDVVERAVKLREGRPLAVLDLALPHDVEPSVADLPGVTLVTLSSLQAVLEDSSTGEDVEAARRIVTDGVGQFLAWQKASRVAPTVVALRSRADEVVAAEVARLEGRLPQLDERARQEIAASLRRVVGTLLHSPTVRVKELSDAPEGLSYADALRELFDLDRTVPAAVAGAPVAVEQSDEPDGPADEVGE